MNRNLTVADFFCGAGGFSEGFRQAGFKIVFALDNWDVARQTHKLNHPECKHPGLDCHFETGGDILKIQTERINEIVDDVDVIIGSPPCVSFSTSNKAGKANKLLGLRLIEKYLQIIAIKKHKNNSQLKYWLLENVPNSKNYIKKQDTVGMLHLNNELLKSLGINKKESDIAISINNSGDNIYNSVYYSVPQKRERFICGEYPAPKKITPKETDWITLGMIIDNLNAKKRQIVDLNYNFSILQEDLTDHYYDTIIPPFEWEEAKIKKQQARYYGKMSFPENPNQPSRTVMATRSVLSRESMILPNGSPGNYRAPTIREVASLMSFPVTYLFQANNEASKYRLVGNAVCPKLAYSLAISILKNEGIDVRKPKIIKADKDKLLVDLRKTNPPKKTPRNKYPRSNFAEIIPDLKHNNFRVELDNGFPKNSRKRIAWRATLHHATGKCDMKVCNPSIDKIESLLASSKFNKEAKQFIHCIQKDFEGKIPDAETFQKQHCEVNSMKNFLTPRGSLRLIKETSDFHFPESTYKNVFLENKNVLRFGIRKIPNDVIPIRMLIAFYGLKYLTNLIKINNRDN